MPYFLYLLPNCGKKYHIWTLNKKGGNIWTGFIQFGIGASHRHSEHNNEHEVSQKMDITLQAVQGHNSEYNIINFNHSENFSFI